MNVGGRHTSKKVNGDDRDTEDSRVSTMNVGGRRTGDRVNVDGRGTNDSRDSVATGSRVPGSGRLDADRAYPGFGSTNVHVAMPPVLVTSVASIPINVKAIRPDLTEPTDTAASRVTDASDVDRAETTATIAIKPIQLIQPSYAKRGRTENLSHSNPNLSIKRLCSLASGARAIRPDTREPPRASPGLATVVISGIAPTMAPTNRNGGCTMCQPGDVRVESTKNRASCTSRVAALDDANTPAPELKSKSKISSSSNEAGFAEPLGKRRRIEAVQDSSRHSFTVNDAAPTNGVLNAGACRESDRAPLRRIRLRSKQKSSTYPSAQG